MGFGWLMVGYFFVSIVALYSPLSVVMLVGYPLMIVGLRLLAPYHKYFHIAFWASLFCIPFAVFFSVDALGKLGILQLSIPAGLFTTVEWLYFVFNFLFISLILLSVFSLCRELELMRWQEVSLRNLLILATTFLLDLIVRLPIGFLQGIAPYASLIILLLRLINVFLNIYLFFGCYRYICPEGDALSTCESDKEKDKKTGKREKENKND